MWQHQIHSEQIRVVDKYNYVEQHFIRLPPGFEFQAHHTTFNQIIFELRHVEKTKINKNRPGFSILKNHLIILNFKISQDEEINLAKAGKYFTFDYIRFCTTHFVLTWKLYQSAESSVSLSDRS